MLNRARNFALASALGRTAGRPGNRAGKKRVPFAKNARSRRLPGAIFPNERENDEGKSHLLVDADADSAGLVLEASARTGHGVRLSRDAREAVGNLHREFDRIASIIIDIDPGAHGLGGLEAISTLRCRPPMLVLTGVEESDMEPIAARHGASACLGKPVSIERLQSAIDHLSSGEIVEEGISCDPWGYPFPAVSVGCATEGAGDR